MSVDRYMPEKKLRATTMPHEVVVSATEGASAYVGKAMAMKIAGQEVIVMARNLPQLNTVWNYVEAHLCGGRAEIMDTLRSSACPDIAMMSKRDVQLDDEL